MNFRKKLRQKLNPVGIISRILSLFSPILDYFESRLIEKYHNEPCIDWSPVFIVGAPRSGSTVYYQLLINELDVVYISNFTHLFYRWLNIGFVLEKFFVKKRNQYSLTSKYGDTLKSGWGAPSECGDFWRNKQPKKNHYFSEQDVNEEVRNFISHSVEIPLKKYNRPFLFKNMHAGQRIGYIKKILPNAKFIFITRDPQFIVQSIIEARHALLDNVNEWWSVKPKEYESIKKLDYIEQVVAQVYYIEKQIMDDFKIIPEEDKMIVTYEELCENTNKVLSDSAKFIFNSKLDFKINNQIKLTQKGKNLLKDQELDRLNGLIAEYFSK